MEKKLLNWRYKGVPGFKVGNQSPIGVRHKVIDLCGKEIWPLNLSAEYRAEKSTFQIEQPYPCSI